jgi:hypothetical protein
MLRKLLFLAVLVQIGQSHLDKEQLNPSSKGSDTRSDGKVTMERSVLETTPPPGLCEYPAKVPELVCLQSRVYQF